MQMICVDSVQMALEQLAGKPSDHAKWWHIKAEVSQAHHNSLSIGENLSGAGRGTD